MVFIVLPAFNEEKNIYNTLQDLLTYGFKNIVVIDDGSSDNTFEAAKNAGVFVLQHLINRGQGAALQTGHEYALSHGAEIIVDFDADGQFDAKDIFRAIEKLKNDKLDAVLGSRFLAENEQIPFTKRYFILPLAKLVNFIFTGIKLTDAHNGFRVFSRAALQKIVITQDRMAHNTEILAQIKKNNFRFAEIPVTVFYKRYGQGIRGGMEILKDLLIDFFIK